MSGCKFYLAIIGACIGISLTTITFSSITANLASIQLAMGASTVELQWMVNAFGILLASTVVTMGRLGDILGRKKVYIIGLSVFSLAMLGSGFAPNLSVLIALQGLAGLAAAICAPMSQALISHLFPENQRGRAIGIWAGFGGFALALGPLLGGAVIEAFSWNWVFWIIVPIALIGIILTAILLKESRTEGESTKIDWLGVFFLTVTIGSFTLAIVQSNLWKFSTILGLFVIAIAAFSCLLWVEKRVRMPIIREDLFKNKMFLHASIGNFCMLGFAWAGFFLIPLFVQKIQKYTPLEAGLLLLFYSVPIGLFSPISGRLYEKVGPKILMLIGFISLLLSLGVQMAFHEQSPFILIAFATLLFGIGVACIWSPSTTAAISTLSRNYAGIASGSFITIQEIGGNLGVALAITAVRLNGSFIQGYHDGVWVLIGLCIIGLIVTLLMPKRPMQKGHG